MSNISLIIIVTLLFAFALTYSRMFYNLLKTKKELVRVSINTVVLEEYIRGLEDKRIESDESIHKENFIKFLSDSRDWAYEYIENVQKELDNFITEIDPLIKYFDNYGDELGMLPNYNGMKKISTEFKKLKSLLPEEPNVKD